MSPSICILVGGDPTVHCGVRDYALRLADALLDMSISAEVTAPPSWKTADFLPFARNLRKRGLDVLHLQYPSVGQRASLWPHLVGRMKLAHSFVVTLHEYSALPTVQRLSTRLFRWTAEQMIFTSDLEMSLYGSVPIPRSVVPIASNVPPAPAQVEKNRDILYFGQIRPNKGLEDFLGLAYLSRQIASPFAFRVLGSVSRRRAGYYEALRKSAPPEVDWRIDLSFEEIARMLAQAFAAYLPFPDGATLQRGSLLAALTNGLPTLTRVGMRTPSELRSKVIEVETPEQALRSLIHLQNSPRELHELSSAARAFAKRFAWQSIAQQHVEIYNQVLWIEKRASQAAAGASLVTRLPSNPGNSN